MVSNDDKKGNMEMIPIPSVPDSEATLANGTASAADASGAEKRRTPADLFFLNRNRPGSVTQLRATPSDMALMKKVQEGGEKKEEDDKKDGKKKEKLPRVPFWQLWRFATKNELAMIFIGIIAAIAHGVTMPLFALFFGDMIDSFGPGASVNLMDSVSDICIKFVILAAVAFVTAYLQVMLFLVTGTRQANRIREIYFKSVIRQEMAYFDVHNSGEVATRMAGDVLLIQDGISDKIGNLVQFIAMFIGGFIVGFISGWKLALVILAVVPLIAACGAAIGMVLAGLSAKGQEAYAKAGSVAEEVLSSMRTVAAFSGEKRELDRYGDGIELARKQNTKKGIMSGLAMGTTMFIMFCTYALAFWYGSTLIESGEMEAGGIVTTFFGVIIGAMALGQAAPNFTTMMTGAGAAYTIFKTIDRKPEIDSLSEEGKKLDKVQGYVKFEGIKFRYPTRPEVPILQGIDLEIKPGQTVALVGPSGCGKSTTVSLLQRFYDPLEGRVLVDGHDIKELNIRWLRTQIGVVSQEPVLFNKTIAQNIAMGKPGAALEEIQEAAKQANAHDFISKLPKGYDTIVGQRGTQLSGGQKQRIAIARALIKNPPILLLDEATSALDTKSERVVQEALDRASKGRSTIVIAHRLSTIQNADKIIVFQKGVIVEQGTHSELMALPDGQYAQLVRLQQMRSEIKDGAANDDDGDDDDVDTVPAVAAKKPTKPRQNTRTESHTSTKSDKSGATGSDGKPDKDEVVLTVDNVETKGALVRSYKMNSPEWPAFISGSLGAAVHGATFPVFALIFAEMLSDLLMKTGQELKERVAFWCGMFIVLAVAVFIAELVQHWSFAYSGEKLTKRLRLLLFKSFMRQEMGWFDDTRRTTGVLATKLANDVVRIEGVTGTRLGTTVQLISTLVVALVIAFTATWQLSLAVLACMPLLALAGYAQMKVMLGFNQKARTAYEQSGSVASEAVENVRTVIQINQEDAFMQDYHDALAEPNRSSMRTAHIGGASFAFSEAVNMLVNAMAFYYGAELVTWGLIDFAAMMRATSAVIFGGMMIGQLASISGDYSKAIIAAAEFFAIVDRKPLIDSESTDGQTSTQLKGEIKFSDVKFTYPSRPDIPILRGLDLEVGVGQTVALVGASGCGKSTTIQLLERFYDPIEGSVTIDGVDTRDLNLHWLRSQIGLVGQEPILFATTILENIRYGKPDATMEEIEAAAKASNAYNFITSLPDGFNTYVGEKGTQLSGGQKQRIAIARALVRNPKILLLDEATSALDSESEKIVQEALDRARLGRTTIVIAHRLSTIVDSDKIVVIDQGKVVEQGTHDQLMALKGQYHHLVENQRMSMI